MSDQKKDVSQTVAEENQSQKSSNPNKNALAGLFQQRYVSPNTSEFDKPAFMGKNNPPIFSADDVLATKQLLARMLRYIFFAHNISMEELMFRTIQFGKRHHINHHQINVKKGNLRKEIMSPSITYTKFEEIITGILRLYIVDATFIFKNLETGKIYTHSLSDTALVKALVEQSDQHTDSTKPESNFKDE